MRGQTLKKVKEKALKLLRFKAFSWQREKDSNPHKQSQSLSCYPYTIPLNHCFRPPHLRTETYYIMLWQIVKDYFQIF